MPHEIAIKKAVLKNLRRLPEEVQGRFEHLVFVLRQSGPTGPHIFQNYGKLGKNEYHCHLTHHYVACWRHEKGTITIEVYYAGSRENAPY
jgi:mRNA-degrading endonuclease RelE of RelBE toxin-antitoxin system